MSEKVINEEELDKVAGGKYSPSTGLYSCLCGFEGTLSEAKTEGRSVICPLCGNQIGSSTKNSTVNDEDGIRLSVKR